MFQLDNKEFANLKSQIVPSSWGGRRPPPLAFTEEGIAIVILSISEESILS